MNTPKDPEQDKSIAQIFKEAFKEYFFPLVWIKNKTKEGVQKILKQNKKIN